MVVRERNPTPTTARKNKVAKIAASFYYSPPQTVKGDDMPTLPPLQIGSIQHIMLFACMALGRYTTSEARDMARHNAAKYMQQYDAYLNQMPSEHPPGSMAHFDVWYGAQTIESYRDAVDEYRAKFPPPYYYDSVAFEAEHKLPVAYDTELSFTQLRIANVARVGEFKNALGNVAHEKSDGSDWTVLEWAGAMCGEAGEAANKAKKLRRGDFGKPDTPTYRTGVQMLAQELADTVIYADLVAKRAGIDLGAAVELTWNTKSNEVGFTGRLQRGAFVAGAAVPVPPMPQYVVMNRSTGKYDANPAAPVYKETKAFDVAYASGGYAAPAPIEYVHVSKTHINRGNNTPLCEAYMIVTDKHEMLYFANWVGVQGYLKREGVRYVWAGRQRENPADAAHEYARPMPQVPPPATT